MASIKFLSIDFSINNVRILWITWRKVDKLVTQYLFLEQELFICWLLRGLHPFLNIDFAYTSVFNLTLILGPLLLTVDRIFKSQILKICRSNCSIYTRSTVQFLKIGLLHSFHALLLLQLLFYTFRKLNTNVTFIFFLQCITT